VQRVPYCELTGDQTPENPIFDYFGILFTQDHLIRRKTERFSHPETYIFIRLIQDVNKPSIFVLFQGWLLVPEVHHEGFVDAFIL